MKHEKMILLDDAVHMHYPNIAGIMVYKDGRNVYENYFHGYTAEMPVHIASVTKSIISALIGIAIGKGYIKDVNQRVLDFFPEYKVMQSETTIQHVTIEHMLTMTAPYKYETEPYEAFFASDNWLNAALELLGGSDPIGAFHYSALVGTHILSGILVKATGQSVLAFAQENLFSPLSIYVQQDVILQNQEAYFSFLHDKHINGWVVDPQGIHTAGWGLTLTARDMAKVGQLYLNGGVWQDKQIIPAPWVAASTTEHSRWGQLSYGYLWWMIDPEAHCYAALGDGGNVIYVNETQRLVVSIASFLMPDVKDRIAFIQTYLVPIFGHCKL